MSALWIGAGASWAAASPPEPAPLRIGSSAELLSALSAVGAGQRIELAAGDYAIDRALVVPDGVTLVGAGNMLFDGEGRPTGFVPGSASTLHVTVAFDGDVLTLGNGSRLERLRVLDLETPPSALKQRQGNVVSVASRAPGDVIAASIVECEIAGPNDAWFTSEGPISHGVAVQTRNPGLGAPPDPHADARISIELRRSIVRTHTGAAVFAINFAPRGRIEAVLEGNRLEGYLTAGGGANRPDPVRDALVVIESRGNLYRRTGLDWFGVHLVGASTPPHITELPGQAAARNQLRMSSVDDRIEGFKVGVQASAARRLGTGSEPLNDNRVELEMRGTRIITPDPGAADFKLRGTVSQIEQEQSPADIPAGDRNVLRVEINGVRGSGARQNIYADVDGPIRTDNSGTGNRLEFVGTREAFLESNRDLDPPPPARFFGRESEARGE
jgi:hypothetical protein